MPWHQRLIEFFRNGLDNFRLHVSRADALLQLSLLGIGSGLLAGIVIIAFRLLIQGGQAIYLPDHQPENFEALSAQWRFLLPVAGGLLVGGLFMLVPVAARRVGVVHVMERLAYHQARLPLRNAVVQFFGAAVCIVFGHSVGREGPSVHLGAASGSLFGQSLGLPNNSLRVLVACGVAAAIAASFNTPLAGVVFAMEVVLMEYTVVGFAPVILAAITATTMTRLVFGSDVAFSVPPMTLNSLFELPYILLMGVLIGGLAAAYIWLLRFFSRLGMRLPLWVSTGLAGAVIGLCAVIVPEIMGIGYDTVNRALLGQLGVLVLTGILLFKLLATSAGLGLGLPGGLIGPSLVIGAAAGGLLGTLGQWLAPVGASSLGLYVLIGMGAMMAGTLQAPLAALMAILELTGNPNIILPGMLAVIAATITCAQLNRKASVFLALMQVRGLDYRNDPMAQSLRRTGVAGIMNRDVAVMPRMVGLELIDAELKQKPRWVLVREASQPLVMLAAADLARERKENPEAETFDLLNMPATRLEVAPIDMQASLQEALDTMREKNAEALYVSRQTVSGIERIYGVLTRDDVERSYRY